MAKLSEVLQVRFVPKIITTLFGALLGKAIKFKNSAIVKYLAKLVWVYRWCADKANKKVKSPCLENPLGTTIIYEIRNFCNS